MKRRTPCLAVLSIFLAGCAAGTGLRAGQESVDSSLRRFRSPAEGKIASGYGGRGGRHHRGIDIIVPEGTPVRAAESGSVFYAGDTWRGYGNAVALDHGGDITSLYGHLREIHVISGDVVPAGATIGTVGRTGNATTPHLHFEIRVGDQPVDPAAYIEGMEKMK